MIYGLWGLFFVFLSAFFVLFCFLFLNQHCFPVISTLSSHFVVRLSQILFFSSLKLQVFSQTLLCPENSSTRLTGGQLWKTSLYDFVGVLPNKEFRASLWQENRTYFLDGYNSLKKQISGTKNKKFTSAWFYRGQENVFS